MDNNFAKFLTNGGWNTPTHILERRLILSVVKVLCTGCTHSLHPHCTHKVENAKGKGCTCTRCTRGSGIPGQHAGLFMANTTHGVVGWQWCGKLSSWQVKSSPKPTAYQKSCNLCSIFLISLGALFPITRSSNSTCMRLGHTVSSYIWTFLHSW